MLDGCHEKYCIQLTCFISDTCTLYRRKTDSLFDKEAATGGVLQKKGVKKPWACNFIKKEIQHRCFPVNFEKFLRAFSLQNTSGGCCPNEELGKVTN